jgi:hypothetical protein
MSAPLTLRIIPGRRIDGSLYVDDGLTVKYEEGQYSLLRVSGSYDASGENLELEIERVEGSLEPMLGSYQGLEVEILLPELASEELAVELNRGAVERGRSWLWRGEWLVVDNLYAEFGEQPTHVRLTVVGAGEGSS